MTAPTTFDPAIHLAYEKPETVITMNDLALGDAGISPIAVTAPFPLFSREGVTQLRKDSESLPSFSCPQTCNR